MQAIKLFKSPISTIAFKEWIWEDRENKRLLILSLLIMTVSFTWLKVLYPFPNFMPPDSNSYIEAALKNQYINTWAIGYSKFLRLISSFSNSHFVLVLVQYLMLQASVVYFLLCIRYLFAPGTWGFRILFCLSISNPLLVHISNFVSSDSLFTTLSIIWFTQLLWIIYHPSVKLLAWHAFIILFAFMVRFNSLYYPIISIVIILLINKTSLKLKISAISLIILLLAMFIGSTQHEYYKKTNTIQYSAFGGWQIAANALYGYAHAKPIPENEVSNEFALLHKIVNRHMDTLKRIPPFLRPDAEVAVYYLWDFKSPLRVYMQHRWKKDTTTEYLKKWASMAPFYTSYGKFLIKKRPIEFLRYYIWPNFIKYYAPPTKFMGVYNMENENVASTVSSWFGWENNKLPTLFKDRKIKIAEVFPVIFALLNIFFVMGLISYIALKGFKDSSSDVKKIMALTAIVWLTNMVFSVFAAPIELRYLLFPMIVIWTFGWLLVTHTLALSFSATSKTSTTPLLVQENLITIKN